MDSGREDERESHSCTRTTSTSWQGQRIFRSRFPHKVGVFHATCRNAAQIRPRRRGEILADIHSFEISVVTSIGSPKGFGCQRLPMVSDLYCDRIVLVPP